MGQEGKEGSTGLSEIEGEDVVLREREVSLQDIMQNGYILLRRLFHQEFCESGS